MLWAYQPFNTVNQHSHVHKAYKKTYKNNSILQTKNMQIIPANILALEPNQTRLLFQPCIVQAPPLAAFPAVHFLRHAKSRNAVGEQIKTQRLGEHV